MIQRVQSIWLFLAGITICCLLFIPIISTNDSLVEYYIIASGLYKKTSGGTMKIESFLPLLISTIATALMCFVNIFNFKKRNVQKRFIMANMALVIGLSFWNSIYAKKIPGGTAVIEYGIGMFLPITAIVFLLLALKGINSDEKLLRSADRLR
jgi:hypothetical protein